MKPPVKLFLFFAVCLWTCNDLMLQMRLKRVLCNYSSVYSSVFKFTFMFTEASACSRFSLSLSRSLAHSLSGSRCIPSYHSVVQPCGQTCVVGAPAHAQLFHPSFYPPLYVFFLFCCLSTQVVLAEVEGRSRRVARSARGSGGRTGLAAAGNEWKGCRGQGWPSRTRWLCHPCPSMWG